MIETERLKLVRWSDAHADPFAAMHADPLVMNDQGGPIGRPDSDAKLDYYATAWREHDVSRWAVEDRAGRFLGYAGVMLRTADEHPLGRHFEIGWRFVRDAWGYGYATESAKAALADAFERIRPNEILSYTSADNTRSQAVMARLKLRRAPSRDFTARYPNVGPWHGMVWIASSGVA